MEDRKALSTGTGQRAGEALCVAYWIPEVEPSLL